MKNRNMKLVFVVLCSLTVCSVYAEFEAGYFSDMGEGFDHCKNLSEKDQSICAQTVMSLYRSDMSSGADCEMCNYGMYYPEEKESNAIVDFASVVAGPLAHFGVNFMWANAYENTQSSWANTFLGINEQKYDAYTHGIDTCNSNFSTALDYNITRGSVPITEDGLTKMMGTCNGMGYDMFSGMGGVGGNGYGGVSNPFGSSGYSSGFLNGMNGPYAGSNGYMNGGGNPFGGGFTGGAYPSGGFYPQGGGNFQIGIGAGAGAGAGFGYPYGAGAGGGIYLHGSAGLGAGGGGGYPYMGGGGAGIGAGFSGGLPSMGFQGFPGIGGMSGMSGIGGGAGFSFPGIGSGIGGGMGIPYPYGGIGAGAGAGININAGINLGGLFGGGGGIYTGGGGNAGYNPYGAGYWGGPSMQYGLNGVNGYNPYMSGGGSYWDRSGGWNNGQSAYNAQYNQQMQYQQYQQELYARQQAGYVRAAGNEQANQRNNQILYQDYVNAGQDLQRNMYSGGGAYYGGSAYGVGQIGGSTGWTGGWGWDSNNGSRSYSESW